MIKKETNQTQNIHIVKGKRERKKRMGQQLMRQGSRTEKKNACLEERVSRSRKADLQTQQKDRKQRRKELTNVLKN